MSIKRGVSLYSYQEEFFLRTMSLEDCIAHAASIGAHGIEVIPEQSLVGYPNITDAQIAQWHQWMATYGTTTSATDLFLDTLRYRDRWLTHEEQLASFRADIDLAVRLGARVIRAIINTPPEVMRDAAPYAREAGVRLLLEVHAPFHYEHPWILEHLEVMHAEGGVALGLMPDMGTFVARFPRVVSERALRDGARPELVDYIVKLYDDHGDTHALMDIIHYRGGGPVEMGLARQATHFIYREPEEMLPHMDLVGHIQAKFYEMVDETAEYSIPYDRIVPVLEKGGFDGYLSSEYEGNRHIQDAHPIDSREQVRRQHAMFSSLLGETGPRNEAI
ncbi:sugar phosphate isomerase/epimerase family protein [Nocardioides sp. AN3]